MISRTYNTELIRKILADPTLNYRVTFGLGVEPFDPLNQPDLIYLLAYDDDGTPIGFLLYHITNSFVCYQVHANYLPEYWGSGIESYSRESLAWMFEHTKAEVITAFCPTIFPEVKRHTEKVDMRECGYLPKSSIYDDKLCDNHIMAITRDQFNGGV